MKDEAGLPIQVGDVLAGKYRVERVLGAGAMGIVAAATHVELGELRAVKFMRASLIQDAAAVERFLREARATARLKNRHVAKVHDVGRLASGAPYIVMEHFEGSDLKTLLAARGVLPVREAVHYVREACEAIAEAHAAGIIHRDLKPSNLFIAAEGGAASVKVLDFGVAKLADGAGPDPNAEMTGTAEVLGTPLYMAPEQMRSTRGVDGRADLWSLGVILYRALTGRTPFSGQTTPEVCISVMVDEPPVPSTLRPDLPSELDPVLMRCLAKDPGRRFATAGELAEALRPFEHFNEIHAAARAPGHEDTARRSLPESVALTATEASTGRSTGWSQGASTTQGRSSRSRILVGSAILFVMAALGAAASVHWFLSGAPTAASSTDSSARAGASEPTSIKDQATAASPEPASSPAPSAQALPEPLSSASASAAAASASAPAKAGVGAGSPSPRAPVPIQKQPPPKPRPTAPVEDAFGTSRK